MRRAALIASLLIAACGPPPSAEPDDAVPEAEVIGALPDGLGDTPPVPDGPPPPAQAPPVTPPLTAAPDSVFEVVEQPPEMVGGWRALHDRIEASDDASGTVAVEVIVEADGTVSAPVVRRSTDAALAEAVVAALRATPFEPGVQAGRPVRVRFLATVRFPLDRGR